MDGNVNLLDWYWEMPVVTRLYFTCSFALTVVCALDLGVSPLHLYFSPRLIDKGEASRGGGGGDGGLRASGRQGSPRDGCRRRKRAQWSARVSPRRATQAQPAVGACPPRKRR